MAHDENQLVTELENDAMDYDEGLGMEDQKSESQDLPSDDLPSHTEGQTPFKHKTIAGRTPEEIEDYVKLLEATTREQGQKLNEAFSQQTHHAPPSVDDMEVTADDYYADPVAAQKKLIESSMSKMMKPFLEDLHQSRESRAWNDLFERYPAAKDHKPLIETLLQHHQIPESKRTPQLLQAYYFMARGIAAEQGNSQATSEPEPTPEPRRKAQQPPLNPQHSAASHPLNTDAGIKKPLRDLTENEERLRRHNNMTKEEFLAEMDDGGPMQLEEEI